MRILLDTTIVIRLGSTRTPVSEGVRAALLADSEILVTPIARAEIAIKTSIGKLHLPVDGAMYWNGIVSRLQATELTFDCTHAERLAKLPLHHRDPFDRMIAAQCLQEDLYLATTDLMFGQYGVKVIL